MHGRGTYNYASGNRRRMFDTIRFSLLTGLAVGAVSITMYELLAPSIMGQFIRDAETVRLGADFLRIRCLATPLMFSSFFTVYVFQGFGRGRVSLFLGMMRWCAFNIPMLFVLNRLMGMYGLVWSQLTADILTVTLSFFVYRRYTRKINLPA